MSCRSFNIKIFLKRLFGTLAFLLSTFISNLTKVLALCITKTWKMQHLWLESFNILLIRFYLKATLKMSNSWRFNLQKVNNHPSTLILCNIISNFLSKKKSLNNSILSISSTNYKCHSSRHSSYPPRTLEDQKLITFHQHFFFLP